ncbi:hypothetical protein KR222_007463, partial [Zaprionus bogoriensis]
QNATEKYNQVQVKKLTVPANEATTKRAALGDLQNRGLSRVLATKDVAHKELKDLKLTKARVDTHWKKQPLGVSNGNAGAAVGAVAAKATAGPLLRSNSMRTGNAAAGQALPKPVVAADEAEPKTTTTTLRREDSKLSRKSLTQLRAALAKTEGVAQKGALLPKKEPLEPSSRVLAKPNMALRKEAPASKPLPQQLKKEAIEVPMPVPVPMLQQVKKEANAVLPMSPGRLNKLRRQPSTEVAPPMPISLSSQRLCEVEDIDAADRENLILVSEYVNDIYDYLFELESQQPVNKDHLKNQQEVSYKMRAVLIDWINEVHLQFHLAPETFHMAVAIIDRYLQEAENTKRKYLQLVGVTALFIATKYEELFPPAIGDFVFITDDTYTGREIRQMELQILKAIDNNLSRPLPIHFLRRFSKAACAEDAHHGMSKYFLELATMDYELASYKPSEIAAASLFLSLHLLNGNARTDTGFNDRHWTPTLVHYSRYTAKQLRPITKKIAKLAQEAPKAKLRTIYNKYQANKFQKISLRPELSSKLLDSIVLGLSQK